MKEIMFRGWFKDKDSSYTSNISLGTTPSIFIVPEGIRLCTDTNKTDRFFEDLIQEEFEWEHATCTVNGIRAFNPKEKLVWKCKRSFCVHSKTLEDILRANELTLATNNMFNAELLKYDTGCFTSRHQDQLGSYTCLLFINNSDAPAAEGGELVLYHRFGMGQTVVKPYELKEDTLAIFPTNLVHEVLPVTSGERYVLNLCAFPMPKYKQYIHKHRPGVKD